MANEYEYYEDDDNVHVADDVEPVQPRLHLIIRLREAARFETAETQEWYTALLTEAADRINELELRLIELENPGIDMAKVIEHRESQRVE